MTDTLISRGPDDSGIWVDRAAGLALGHRRLSIVDLTFTGHQPMHSVCNRYCLVFNGEIYNHIEIRERIQLESSVFFEWNGHSDTETLLAALVCWGIDKTLAQLNGMFSFALWDKLNQTLTLARDRMGEKPLYYGMCGESFIFGSELKAFLPHPDWIGKVNRNALALYMRHNCIPAPYSIYDGVNKLPPASYVLFKAKGKEMTEPYTYWDLAAVAENGIAAAKCNHYSESELVKELEGLCHSSIEMRMQSDLPLGAFLSGGYDSSLVAAVMQSQNSTPVKTFSIGFSHKSYNEAHHAKAVAKHLSTDHTELYISAEEALSVIPNLPFYYDEPFSDSSQIPTFLVCELARQSVTVVLSGDGGDELFAGYNRHVLGPKLWQTKSRIPRLLRKSVGTLIKQASRYDVESLVMSLNGGKRIPGLSNKLQKVGEALDLDRQEDFYLHFASHWKSPESVVLGAEEPISRVTNYKYHPGDASFLQKMQFLDQVTYLPDDILTKLDRASMAVSLEARVPFLDHRLVEFAWTLPSEVKIRDGKGKWLLRELLYQYVPKDLLDRPKQGFGVPLAHWLRGPLRDWAETLLDEKRLTNEGFFNVRLIRDAWIQHLSGKDDWQYHLWDVLMFQAWLEANPTAH